MTNRLCPFWLSHLSHAWGERLVPPLSVSLSTAVIPASINLADKRIKKDSDCEKFMVAARAALKAHNENVCLCLGESNNAVLLALGSTTITDRAGSSFSRDASP